MGFRKDVVFNNDGKYTAMAGRTHLLGLASGIPRRGNHTFSIDTPLGQCLFEVKLSWKQIHGITILRLGDKVRQADSDCIQYSVKASWLSWRTPK